MNREEAHRIVAEWESRSDEIVFDGSGLCLPTPGKFWCRDHFVAMDGSSEPMTCMSANSAVLREEDYQTAKRLLDATSKSGVEALAADLGRPLLAGTAQPKRIIPLKEPDRRRDDWPDIIIDAVKIFEKQFHCTPNAAQLWSQLTTNPPPGYAVAWNDRGRCLSLPGNPPLNRTGFNDRFERLYPKT